MSQPALLPTSRSIGAIVKELLLACLVWCWNAQPTLARAIPQDGSVACIITKVVINWNNSGQTLCAAYNECLRPVEVAYDVYPFSPGRGGHGTARETLGMWQWGRIFGWIDGQSPAGCSLISATFK